MCRLSSECNGGISQEGLVLTAKSIHCSKLLTRKKKLSKCIILHAHE